MIVAFSKWEDAKKIKNILNRNGYDDILTCNSASQVIAAANENDGGIVLCGYRLPDMHCSELHGYLPREFQMLLVASPARLQEYNPGNILSLPLPFHTHELISTIETMQMQRDGKKSPLRARPEGDRRVIEEAKRLLMERNHLSEGEAHRYIQKLSMDSGNSMVEIAGMILAFD